MSGHPDPEFVDAWNKARDRGLARGVRPVWMEAAPLPDGRRWFRFEFAPIEKARKVKADRAPPMPSSPAIRRGGVPPRQGSLL